MEQSQPTEWIDSYHDRYHDMVKTLGRDIDSVFVFSCFDMAQSLLIG